MSKVTFQYDVVDAASYKIDGLQNKMHELRGAYRETRREISHLRHGLHILSGLGIGVAGEAMAGLGLEREARGKKGDVYFEPTNFGKVLSGVGRIGSLIAGGAIAGQMLSRMGEGGSFGRGGSTMGRSGTGIASSVTSSVISNTIGSSIPVFNAGGFSGIDANGNVYQRDYKAPGGIGAPGSKLRSDALAGIRGVRGIGEVASGIGGGLLRGIASGVAGLGIALGIQMAFEYGVQPIVEQLTNKPVFNDDYLKNLSGTFLSDKKAVADKIFKESTSEYGGGMYLTKEVLGRIPLVNMVVSTPEEDRIELQKQILHQQISRMDAIQSTLWNQSRQ